MLLIRTEDELPDDAIIVRGGRLVATSVVRSAELSMAEHGFYGVSVFLAEGGDVADLVARTPELSPHRYRQLRMSTVGRLRHAGFALLATHESPHYDIMLPDVESSTVAQLSSIFDLPLRNSSLWP